MTQPSVERDTPRWPDAYAGIYARIKYQSYLHALSLVAILGMAFFLFRLGYGASAHVYEVHADGSASYVGDRQAQLQPRPAEAAHVARQFVQLLYGWNSSTVDEDLTAAINLCAPEGLGAQLRREVASAQFIAVIRKKRIRAEVDFADVSLLEAQRRYYRVSVDAQVHFFPLTQYDSRAVETKPVNIVLVLQVVPRSPERLNGLEIVRLERTATTAADP